MEKLRYDKNGQKFKVWIDRFDIVIIKISEVLFTKA
jgi:predicted secreted protein